MNQQRKVPSMRRLHALLMMVATAAALSSLLACNSKPAASLSKGQTAEQVPAANGQSRSAAAQHSSDPGLNLNCVYERLQNPPESFHYVYKKTTSDGAAVYQEADVTPQAIDGSRAQPDGSPQPIHAVHSDPQGWQAALAGLTGISGMSSTVSTINHNSAMQRESDGGQVNGYQTIHYSIDTARWDETTRKILGDFALGPGGYDKGDAWVTADGCPVKLTLDDEMHKKDGSFLEKVHYEEEMVKK